MNYAVSLLCVVLAFWLLLRDLEKYPAQKAKPKTKPVKQIDADQVKADAKARSAYFVENKEPYKSSGLWGSTWDDFCYWWDVVGDHKVAVNYDQYLVNVAGTLISPDDQERSLNYARSH